jgi:hypothetical protein
MIQQNDSTGGAGSLLGSILGIAVNGLSTAVDGELSKKYPLTSMNENLSVDAFGNLRPTGAPQNSVSFGQQVAGILTSPVGVALGVAFLAGALVLIAVKLSK